MHMSWRYVTWRARLYKGRTSFYGCQHLQGELQLAAVIPIQESILKQFVPLDTDIRGEEGQNSREWSEVLDDFGSKRVYQERLFEIKPLL